MNLLDQHEAAHVKSCQSSLEIAARIGTSVNPTANGTQALGNSNPSA